MIRLLMGAALMTTAACATAAEEDVPVRGGRCDASKAQKLLGRPRSAKLGAQALRLSGAKTLRWIAPGTMVTMDFRENRLNLRTDPRNRVVKIDCG
jgi:hypothetical protein